MDEHQEKLHDLMERLDWEALDALMQQEQAPVGDVGRSLWHQLKGCGSSSPGYATSTTPPRASKSRPLQL
ncbi:hypothetical protein [Bradyrhizobium sp. Ghvi]|uniref:hypothetical protein n=1 Tax=Bradyrhizobium sp. Ghvi TaxID=1855319 RepID=UPI001177BD14|nr:hypothetical protein [Bradyrhizobium sp. Ghvi]